MTTRGQQGLNNSCRTCSFAAMLIYVDLFISLGCDITNVTRSPCRSFNAFGDIAGSPWLGWWWAPELCQSCTHHHEGASPSTRPESLCNTHRHRKSWKHVLLLEQSRCDTSSYSYKCWYCHLQIEELAVNIKEQSQLSDWHVSCGGGISTYSDSEAFQACTYCILVRSCILLAVRHSDTTSKCPARMLSHRQVWQCLCNEQWPTQRSVGFIEVMQWCIYVVQQNVEKNLHEVMKSKSVSVRPIWSPHFNVLWIGEWFTAASGALKTFTKSPRVLTFDEANPTRMIEQCAILVWLLVLRMTQRKNFDIMFMTLPKIAWSSFVLRLCTMTCKRRKTVSRQCLSLWGWDCRQKMQNGVWSDQFTLAGNMRCVSRQMRFSRHFLSYGFGSSRI